MNQISGWGRMRKAAPTGASEPQIAKLFDRARRIVHSVREAEAAVLRHDDRPRGLLRVSVPAQVPEVTFTQWLSEFMSEYPDVSLDVLSSESQVDLIAESVDVGLFHGAIEDDSLVSRTLAVNTEVAVATPEYLQQHGTPTSVEQLAEHQCIIGYKNSNVPDPRWPLLDGGFANVSGKLMTNHVGMRMQAALRHLGIAVVVKRYAEPYLESGKLMHVLPGVIGQVTRARLVYPRRDFLEPKVRAFVDFIAKRVEAAHKAPA